VASLILAGGARAADPSQADRHGTAVVNVVAYGTSGSGKSIGTCKPVRVTAERSADNQARVGFFESEVGGTGS
jgi:hypothetical protein